MSCQRCHKEVVRYYDLCVQNGKKGKIVVCPFCDGGIRKSFISENANDIIKEEIHD